MDLLQDISIRQDNGATVVDHSRSLWGVHIHEVQSQISASCLYLPMLTGTMLGGVDRVAGCGLMALQEALDKLSMH